MSFLIRFATPQDAAGIQAVYTPYVRDTPVSFEIEPPTVEEMAARMAQIQAAYPYLVCERDEEIVGYAYAGVHRARPAYQWSAEVTVYIRADCHRLGIGRALYTELLRLLTLLGYHNAFAGITLPNAASVGLHEAIGFQSIGVFCAIGYKAGAWYDVGWWRYALQDHEAGPANPPAPPRPIGDFLTEKVTRD